MALSDGNAPLSATPPLVVEATHRRRTPLWTHGEENFPEFANFLNSAEYSIKFAVESSKDAVNCCPDHEKKGIPSKHTFRIRRICSKDSFWKIN